MIMVSFVSLEVNIHSPLQMPVVVQQSKPALERFHTFIGSVGGIIMTTDTADKMMEWSEISTGFPVRAFVFCQPE